MTDIEAMQIAQRFAVAAGWPWVEPVHTMRRRSGWMGTGSVHWEVLSNARSRGDNALVTIDDATSNVVASSFPTPRRETSRVGVTEFEAVEIARRVASTKGWPWEGPIGAIRRRRGWFGARYWNIRSNIDYRGRNVSVAVDEATGQVLGSGFLPR